MLLSDGEHPNFSDISAFSVLTSLYPFNRIAFSAELYTHGVQGNLCIPREPHPDSQATSTTASSTSSWLHERHNELSTISLPHAQWFRRRLKIRTRTLPLSSRRSSPISCRLTKRSRSASARRGHLVQPANNARIAMRRRTDGNRAKTKGTDT